MSVSVLVACLSLVSPCWSFPCKAKYPGLAEDEIFKMSFKDRGKHSAFEGKDEFTVTIRGDSDRIPFNRTRPLIVRTECQFGATLDTVLKHVQWESRMEREPDRLWCWR